MDTGLESGRLLSPSLIAHKAAPTLVPEIISPYTEDRHAPDEGPERCLPDADSKRSCHRCRYWTTQLVALRVCRQGTKAFLHRTICPVAAQHRQRVAPARVSALQSIAFSILVFSSCTQVTLHYASPQHNTSPERTTSAVDRCVGTHPIPNLAAHRCRPSSTFKVHVRKTWT